MPTNVRSLIGVGLIVGAGLVGCGKSEPSAPTANQSPVVAHTTDSDAVERTAPPTTASAVTATQPAVVSSGALTQPANNPNALTATASTTITPTAPTATQLKPPTDDDFFACVITEIDPESKLQLPPETTVAGKSTADLLAAVEAEWSKVPLRNQQGQLLQYSVRLDTRLGPVIIRLNSALAPTHVRNFLTLARVGYYDGLFFERIIKQTPTSKDNGLLLVEAGCPAGKGDQPERSHLGYWLKSEVSADSTHLAGSVGMCLVDAQPDTGACRFYVALEPHPNMNGVFTVFGQVTNGLEILRQFASGPVVQTQSFASTLQPAEPLRIDRVSVIVE